MQTTLFVKTVETPSFQHEMECIQSAMDRGTKWNLAEAETYCRNWGRNQYENFTVVSLLLPKSVRQDFYNIYAYCRWSDNLADEIEEQQRSLQLLGDWESELRLCWGGQPKHPILVALQRTAQENRLSQENFLNLLSAFRQDRQLSRYGDAASLLDYCTRSANPVGRILLELANCMSDKTQPLSDDICTGLQIANFCQDMSRDAAIGRIYAPEELWSGHGVTESMILKRQPTDELKSMLREWVQETHQYFHRGKQLIALVPKWLATDVELFLRGGQSILQEIERQDYDVWTRRPEISKWKKLKLLLGIWCWPR